MRGIVSMVITHQQMCSAITAWLRDEVYISHPTPNVIWIRQSKNKETFSVYLEDKPEKKS